ncbi:hypothetical protein EPO34_01610 [Patescibacteria group bacterium]|nr:MAG: hypothetical protein EPO34_01610 [Patescibacteria group bacterium]
MKQPVAFHKKAISAAKTTAQLTLVVGVAVPVIAAAGSLLAADLAFHHASKAIKRRLAERHNARLDRRSIRG